MTLLLDMPNLVTYKGNSISYYPTMSNGWLKTPTTTYAVWIDKMPNNVTSFEYNIKFKTGDTVSNGSTYWDVVGQKGSSPKNPLIEIEAGYIYVYGSSSDSSWDIVISAPIEANKTYTINTKWDNTTGKLTGTLTDDENSVEMEVVSGKTDTSNTYSFGDYVAIGSTNGQHKFEGVIDLKSSYIKINGGMWWQGLAKTDCLNLFIQPYEALGGVQ